MSRTKRNDYKNQEGKRPDLVFEGWMPLPETPEWKRTKDGKPWNKSASWYKKQEERRRRAKRNQEIKNFRAGNIEDVELTSPKEPRENDWNWT